MDLVVKKQHRRSYTGGKVVCSHKSHSFVIAMNKGHLSLLSLMTGEIIVDVNGYGECLQNTGIDNGVEVDSIITFDLSTDDTLLAFYTRHGLIRIVSLDTENELSMKLLTEYRVQSAENQQQNRFLITCLQFSTVDSSMLIGGTSDGSVYIWTVQPSSLILTHSYSNIHQFPITCLTMKLKSHVFSASADGHIFAWQLNIDRKISNNKHLRNNQHMTAKKRAHRSAVINMLFVHNSQYLISVSMQDNICVWNAHTFEQLSDLKFKYSISCVNTTNDGLMVGDEDGNVHYCKLRMKKALLLHEISSTKVSHYSLTNICSTSSAYVITSSDCDLFVGELIDDNWITNKTYLGFNDEILDIVSIPNTNKIIIASNSAQLRVLDMNTFDWQLCFGHSSTIMSVAIDDTFHWIATASKDMTVRFWKYSTNIECKAIGTEHSSNVNCISFIAPNIFVSGSKGVLKFWDLTLLSNNTSTNNLSSILTLIPHENEIMDIDISTNKEFMISCGTDSKLVLYQMENTSNLNAFKVEVIKESVYRKGRVIWSVRFSDYDRICASAHNNGEIRIWSLSPSSLLQCLKVFENRNESILNLRFIHHGLQIIASSNTGLLKLFTLKTNECNKVYQRHFARIWALHVNEVNDELVIITGASDSMINVWKDEFAINEKLKIEQLHENQSNKTEIENCIRNHNYVQAIELCLKLEFKRKLLHILLDIFGMSASESVLEAVLRNLAKDAQLLSFLLSLVIEWNTNSKYCEMCQLLLFILYNTFHIEQLLLLSLSMQSKKFEQVNIHASVPELFENESRESRKENFGKMNSALIAYSNRHYNRVNLLLTDLNIIDFVTE